jgi:transcriptional regulator with XRE-family HTH domain
MSEQQAMLKHGALPPSPQGQFGDFRVQLRERREAAGMSRAELARRSGVSQTTIRNLEQLRQPLSERTLLRLLSVIELGMDPPSNPALRDEGRGPHLNCWLAPGFDPIKALKELVQLANGQGGYVEQSYMYLDPMSAACWLAIAEQEAYASTNRSVPLERAAHAVVRCAGKGVGLDLFGLGSGDGKLEVSLARDLLARQEQSDLNLYLVDISQPLLTVAYAHAAEALQDCKGARVAAIQGNFHHLPRYTQLLYTSPRPQRRRLVCMLGVTFGNLENEILFVRNSLHGFSAGDMLLFDVPLVFAPADQPEEIRRRDPWLADRAKVPWQARVVEFLTGPLRRYGRDVRDIELRADLGTGWCPVPGSYAVEIEAVVKGEHGQRRRFTLFHIKRHDPIQLIQTMKGLGWDPIDGWRYGEDGRIAYPHMLYLFRRRA